MSPPRSNWASLVQITRIFLSLKIRVIIGFFNLCPTPILILQNVKFKILRESPGNEALQVSFKSPRRGWDQKFADFNRFSSLETRSCYYCLLYLHEIKIYYHMVLRCKRICKPKQTVSEVLIDFNIINLHSCTKI